MSICSFRAQVRGGGWRAGATAGAVAGWVLLGAGLAPLAGQATSPTFSAVGGQRWLVSPATTGQSTGQDQSSAAAPSSSSTSVHALAGVFGFGVAPVVGGISNKLNTGWDFLGGLGYNFSPQAALLIEYQYNHFGVNSSVLSELAVPSGVAHLWSLTADPVFKLSPSGPLVPYVTGGIGFYRRTVEFLSPTLAPITVFDPWWGFVGTAVVPANVVLGKVSENAFGANGGVGIEFRLPHAEGGSFFAEIRYTWANTHPGSTTFMPITFGFRW